MSSTGPDDPVPLVVGLGELIWDLLPGGKMLGGAPSNFAYISRLLGNEAAVASRVGDDDLGRQARDKLTRMGIETGYVQVDRLRPTGTVAVTVDERGEPHFSVNENSAWDYLELSPRWEELASRADVVCFGTLGQRRAPARETILGFLGQTRREAVRVFDVNLRHSFFTTEMLAESLAAADVVKLNRAEMSTAAQMLGLAARGRRALCERLIESFDLQLVAVTDGRHGSLLVTGDGAVEHPGYMVRVVDTIGCGDAFTAALAHCYLRRVPLQETGTMANRVGAWVASQAGATPEVEPSVVGRLLRGSPDVHPM